MNKIIQPNIFIESAKKYSVEDLKPLFILKIVIDYEIARYTNRKIAVDLQAIAYKYNGIAWEYVRDVNRNFLMIKDP
ncbi:MAG: hypothetical protein HQK77_09835 [Desulfobacterales bacterium]|nr:hypothetical protein [Desulfobacterales bacterium]